MTSQPPPGAPPAPRPSELRPLDAPYLHHLDGTPVDPVFILGPHRSGTTVLHRFLLATGCFNTTSMYNMLYRRALLRLHFHPEEAARRRRELVDYFASRGLRTRGYDSTPVGPDAPEEYGEAVEGYQGRRPLLTEENQESFLTFARKIQFVDGPERVLLLKNPWDTTHFVALARLFPTARFVFIHRAPLRTIDSQIRMFASLLREHNEYEDLLVDWYRELFTQPLKVAAGRLLYAEWSPWLTWKIARHVTRCGDYMLAHRARLGDRAIDVTYDELCAKPDGSMRRVMAFLALEPAHWPDYVHMVQTRRRPLLPLVAGIRPAIERRNQAYAAAFGV